MSALVEVAVPTTEGDIKFVYRACDLATPAPPDDPELARRARERARTYQRAERRVVEVHEELRCRRRLDLVARELHAIADELVVTS